MNLNLATKYLFFFYLFNSIAVAQNPHQGKYLKYIDSASNTIDENPKIAALYLDSIPKPLSENIKGHLACFYELKVLINDKNQEKAKQYQNSVLALKYAELEKNYDIAGWASLELFYNSYIIKKDSTSYKYLENAQKFYSLDNNRYGLVEITQMQALAELNNNDYAKSNQLLLKNLENYKSIEDDAYYHMYGLFLLTTNYLDLDSLNKAHKYFKTLKSLKDNATITPSLHESHLATIYGCFGEFHFDKKAIDSTLFYLSKSESVRTGMSDKDKRNYYNLYIDYYDYKKDFKSKNDYIDSLGVLEDLVLKKTMDASLFISDTLMQSESELGLERKDKKINKVWIIILACLMLLGLSVFIIKNKKSKKVIKNFKKNTDDYTYLKSNHEKLKVKMKGMEGYISEVKKEIKNISSINDIKDQHNRIRELYKNIHHNSSTLLAKGEDHLDLINELNVDFFNQLSLKHPDLNPSEKVVCYYIFMGFKSKEIGAFINTSTRAVESKRYRINSKLNLKKKDYKLVDYLAQTFKESEK